MENTPPPPLPREDEWSFAVGDGDTLLDDLLDEEATADANALLMELLGEEPAAAITSSAQLTEMLLNLPRPSYDALPHATAEPVKCRVKTSQVRTLKSKHTLESLRLEASQLTSEIKRLRSECGIREPHVLDAMEAATAERLKRRRVEDECRQLREAVFAQTQFIRGLRSVFSTPLALSAMDLTRYLHNYTRLPRDQATRWNEYAALAQEARLQSAMDILCRETKAMAAMNAAASERAVKPSVENPLIRTEVLHHARQGGFGVTSTSVFAVETTDLGAVLRGVCVAARDIMTRSQCYECTDLKRQIVGPDALPGSSSHSNILVRLAPVDHENPPTKHELSIESHVLTLSKQTDDYGVVMWDFVDDDELHPKTESTDITRQAVGACMVRREICDDGAERAVCRAIRTRCYRFHECARREVLQRFEGVIASMMKVSDLEFRAIVMGSVATEEAVYAQALSQLQTVAAASEP